MIMDKNKKEEMKNWLETNISETDEQRIIQIFPPKFKER